MAMAVLLDTAQFAERDRRDALITTMRDTSGVSQVKLGDDEPVHARLDLWWFGSSAILRAESNDMSLIRTARAARSDSGEHIAIGVHEYGVARYQVGATTRVVPAGEVLVVDVSRPFTFGWHGCGAAFSLNTWAEDLALPPTLIRQASQRLQTSPLYGLASRHIADVTRHADALSASSVAHTLGAASIELARALIATAVDDTPGTRDVIEQTLITQVRAYVRQHLRDPDLSPDMIAAALAISTRHLYRVCTRANLRLEQWIISTRLDHAKAELAHPSARHRSIAGVARTWGFTDPTHFSRRFRAAFGMLPSEWRRGHQPG
jgi:AraC-like DNA-binding protein